MEALYAYGSSEYAIIAGSEGWADALSSTSLAGGLKCPILLTNAASVPSCTLDALSRLGVSKIIVVGGPNTVSESVLTQLENKGFAVEKRLGGADRYAVQLNIYQYGLDKGLWTDSRVIIASGNGFSDALSVSPVAYRDVVPIFLVNNGALNAAQKSTLTKDAREKGMFKETIIVGGPDSVSQATQTFMGSVSALSSGMQNHVTRLGGADRYEASANIAAWATSPAQGFTWDGAAFSSGDKPYDALAGSAVQGTSGSVLLLVNSKSNNPTIKMAAENKGSISSIKFFGGNASITDATRSLIRARLGFGTEGDLVSYRDYSITLDKMANLEVKASVGYQNYSKSQILEYLDPDNFSFGEQSFYQFAVLSDGYSHAVSASQINSFIASVPKGANGMLAGQGQTFIDAAEQYGVNEVYLLAHAILESGWGTSELANGYRYSGGTIDGTYYPAGTYYNFYGIGAYDDTPLSGGRKLAIINGWNSPEKAITGAARWIAKYYINDQPNPQNTLYKMKWDIQNAMAPINPNPWHQYATSRTWAVGIAAVMSDCYRYNKLDMAKSGLIFEVPSYA